MDPFEKCELLCGQIPDGEHARKSHFFNTFSPLFAKQCGWHCDHFAMPSRRAKPLHQAQNLVSKGQQCWGGRGELTASQVRSRCAQVGPLHLKYVAGGLQRSGITL